MFRDVPKEEFAFENMIFSVKCILSPQKPPIQSHYSNRGGARIEGAGLKIFLKFYDFHQFLLGRKIFKAKITFRNFDVDS